MGNKRLLPVFALCVTAGSLLLSGLALAQTQTGPALVTSTASEILQIRDSAPSSDTWVVSFTVSSTRSEAAPPLAVKLTLSDDGYTAFETKHELQIIDHKLSRLFRYHNASHSFRNGSISEAPAFAVWEWQSRARLAQMVQVMFKDDPETLKQNLLLHDLFWVSHDLGVKLPSAPDDGARLEESQEALKLFRKDEEVAFVAFSDQSLPKDVLQRFWGTIQRIRPLHPLLAARSIAEGRLPTQINTKSHNVAKPYVYELNFETASKESGSFPLPADAELRQPAAAEVGAAAAEMFEIGQQAMAGSFAPGTPDDAYWIARFKDTLAGDKLLETFLTYFAFALFTSDNRWFECDQQNFGNQNLCRLWLQAGARMRGQQQIGRFVQLQRPPSREAKLIAIRELERFKNDAGRMAPLVSLFIANHIEDVTQTITKASDIEGHPDRNDAAQLYLEALREFPFIRSIYGDIAEYYINFFATDRAYFFADVGRNLPLETRPRTGGNLETFTRTEQRMRVDFPIFY